MAEKGQVYDLNELKKDANLWMRFAMQSEDTGALRSVFPDKENPFLKNAEVAMMQVQELAQKGKLFLRERGRSRHFHKVEQDGENLKLGDRQELKMANNTADPVRGLLWRLSRSYFNWIGLESIANWFDRRIKRREELIELDERYRAEYKSLTSDEKKQLKQQQKTEKAQAKHRKKLEKLQKALEKAQAEHQKKLEKLQKEMDNTRKEYEKLGSKGDEKEQGSKENPVTKPPENEQTQQPTQTNTLQNQTDNLVSQQTVQEQIVGKKNDAAPTNENTDRIMIGNAEFSAQNMAALPPEIQTALQTIQNFVQQQKTLEQQIPQQNQPQQTEVNPALVDNPNAENVIQQNENMLLNNEQVQHVPNEAVNNQQQQEMDHPNIPIPPQQNPENEEFVIEENNMEQLENVPGVHVPNEAVNNQQQQEIDNQNIPIPPPENEIHNPINQPPNPEPERIGMQNRPAEQQPLTRQERLAAEKQALDAVKNWSDFLAKGLFVSEESKNSWKEFKESGAEREEQYTVLSGFALGLLANDTVDPNAKQAAIDTLLSGRPLDGSHQNLAAQGAAAYNQAKGELDQNNPEAMAQLLTKAAIVLGQQASKEPHLSSRSIMIGRLINNTASLCEKFGVQITLDENQTATVKGAAEMGKLAQRYLNARQHLANNPLNMEDKKTRIAVCDLLAGRAVETMIEADKREGREATKTQELMGKEIWSAEQLRILANGTPMRKVINQKQIDTILDEPHGFRAAAMGARVGLSITKDSENIHAEMERANQRNLGDPQVEQPAIHGLNG